MAGRKQSRAVVVGHFVSLSLFAGCDGGGTTLVYDAGGTTLMNDAQANQGHGDTQAPSVPSSLSASLTTQTSFTLAWAAATDNVGVTGYEVFQNGVSKGLSTATSFAVAGLTAATTYAMTVRARDAAGNWSAQSAALSVVTASSAQPDTQAPTVAVSSPANGASVATTFSVSAAASDNVGVAGVQFFLDGSAVGAEVTSAPYSVTVSTTATMHTIYAHARDAAGNSSDSTRITVTSSAPAAGTSIEFGRTLYGTDDSLRNDAPSGGTLFSVWTKIPDPGSIPWSRGNMDDYVLYGRNWYMRCLTGNGSATSATSASFNANSMLFVNPGDTWVNDYSYYLNTELTDSQVRGWVWAAWQVVVNADSFTIRQWLKFGLNGAVIAAGESNPTFTEIRSALVSLRGFTTARAAAWVPGDATSFHVGKDNGYLTHARMAATSVTPTLAALDAIARANAADTSAWADYELVWVNGAPNLSDRSGHGRNLSIEAGGTLYAGPAGPAF